MAKATALTAVLGMIGAVFVFDDRYAKQANLTETLQGIKTEIISEMRSEIVKNRSAMISDMQREADDLEYEMAQYQKRGEEPPRYMIEKQKQILRDIEELKSE
jgi:predicted sulfurtransferase